MMVHEISGEPLGKIDAQLPFACGLHFVALWWLRENARRQLNAFGKVPVIRLLRPGPAAGPAVL